MNLATVQVRRANLDDLQRLRRLWEHYQFPADALEKRLTEFQVAVAADGQLLGALGLRIDGRQGQVHGEVFGRPEDGEALRALLWERLQVLARNHGLTRLWTQEPAEFWRHPPFADAAAEVRPRLPASFGDLQGAWRTLQLREEVLPAIQVEREFDLFMRQQSESTERALRQGRWLKRAATLLALVLLALVAVGALYVFSHLVALPKLR
ncbi:MAG: hypothetical protein KGS61_06435 [Verrucomicrobia bacterium]|nr:hypothetical protein [Verrucomicrobiota bacterium]